MFIGTVINKGPNSVGAACPTEDGYDPRRRLTLRCHSVRAEWSKPRAGPITLPAFSAPSLKWP